MKKAVETFFNKLDKMYEDMYEFADNAKDRFWAYSIDYALPNSKVKKYKKNPLLNEGVRMVNGHIPHPMVFIWRDSPKGDYNEFYGESEKVKIIHSYNGYDFCIIRDRAMLQLPTDTRWSNAFIGKTDNGNYYKHKYAILKGEEVLFSTHKRWLFEKKILNKDFEGETLEYNVSPTGILRSFNPFKIKILNRVEDINEIREIEESCGFYHGACDMIQDMDDKGMSTKNLWIVFMIGLTDVSTRSLYGKDRNATWWGVYSNTKPTQDDVIENILNDIQWYKDYGNDLADVLTQKREEAYDLNKLDFNWEERLRYMFTEKLPYSFASVLGHGNMRLILKTYDKEMSQCP